MNVTNITIGEIKDFVGVMNQEVYGYFGIVLLLAFTTITFINLSRRYKPSVAMFFSVCLNLPLVILFSFIGFFDSSALIIYLLVLGCSAVFAWVV